MRTYAETATAVPCCAKAGPARNWPLPMLAWTRVAMEDGVIIGVPREIKDRENRVSVTPAGTQHA